MSYQLPPLNYETNALEPHIDAKTMEIHHDKHHNAYVTNLNNAVSGTEYDGQELTDLMKKITKDTPPAVRNNGGGHFNHSLFWEVIKPGGANVPSGALLEKINSDLGGVEKFKEDFAKAAATRFGSGWAWLCVKSDGKLCVCSSPNQDNPLMGVSECPGTPILGLDVWEHAYYLNYQNRRPDYIQAFWSVVNWDEVTKRYQAV